MMRGITLTAAALLTTAAFPPLPPAYYDVVGKGADPSGANDSADAINSAITAACAFTRPVPVYIPLGTYKIEAASIKPNCSNLTVYGGGPGATTLLQGRATGSMLFIDKGFTNIVVKDMTLDGNAPTQTANNSILASVFRGDGAVFDNVTFQNTLGQALQFSETKSSGIRNSLFNNISQYWHTSGSTSHVKQAITFTAGGGQVTGSISADGSGTGVGTVMNITGLLSANAAITLGGGTSVIVNGAVVAHTIPCVVSGAQTCTGKGGVGRYSLDTALNVPAGSTIWTDPSDLYPGNFVENVVATNAGFDVVNVSWVRDLVVRNVTCNLGSGPLSLDLPSQQWFNTSTKVGAACVFVYGVNGMTLQNIRSEVASGNGFDINGFRGATISGNQSNRSGWAGFMIAGGNPYGTAYGTSDFTFTGNVARNNNQSPMPPVPHNSGLTISTANITTFSYRNGVVSGNVFSDDQAVPTQQYGIAVQGAGALNVLANSIKFPGTNTFSRNVVAPFSGVLALVSGNRMYSATSDQVLASTSATTCLAGGNGAKQMPQNALAVGSSFRLTCSGRYTTPASSPGTITVTVKYGAATVISATSPTLTISQTNAPFSLDATCTVRTLGATGTMVCNGAARFSDAAGATLTAGIGSATPGTIDTTTSGDLDMLMAWSTVAGGQTATSQQASLEVLN